MFLTLKIITWKEIEYLLLHVFSDFIKNIYGILKLQQRLFYIEKKNMKKIIY